MASIPLPSDPSKLRVYVYRLPDDLACCFPTPASTCSAFGRNGSGRLRSWPNFAEAHVGAVFERSGQVTIDPRRAHVFYLPACLVSTFLQLRERRKDRVALSAEYERRLIAHMDGVGLFWRDQRHRHMLHRAQCNRPVWSKRLLPELWPPSISHAAIELCFEVATGTRAGLSPSQWGPHVLLPYYVAPEEYRPVPTRAQFLARQSIMGFCGSLFAGREYVVRALANLSRAQLIMPPGSQLAVDYLSQGRPYLPGPRRMRSWFKSASPSSPSQDRWASNGMHELYSEVQFALMPKGDTIFRRAAAEAIAAGAIPMYSPDRRTGMLQFRLMPFRECLPAGLQVDEALGAAVPEAELAANALGTYEHLVNSPALDRMLHALTEVQAMHNYHSPQFADCLSRLIVGAIRAPAQRPPAARTPQQGANASSREAGADPRSAWGTDGQADAAAADQTADKPLASGQRFRAGHKLA
jgi:hypothetical protein